jgi:hypothetical protein
MRSDVQIVRPGRNNATLDIVKPRRVVLPTEEVQPLLLYIAWN